jgi:uncharacterized protein (TIGR00106 family)
MLGEFSIVPLEACTSVGSRVAEVLRLIDARDIVYKVTPMGTIVEGAGEDVLRLIKRCHQIALLKEERVLTAIRIDERKGAKNMINANVRSVGKRLWKVLKK